MTTAAFQALLLTRRLKEDPPHGFGGRGDGRSRHHWVSDVDGPGNRAGVLMRQAAATQFLPTAGSSAVRTFGRHASGYRGRASLSTTMGESSIRAPHPLP